MEALPPRPARGLWVLCILVGSVVLLMWAAGRVKPLVVYPLLVGCVLGVWARIASAVCHVPLHRWWLLLPMLCAMAVSMGSVVLAAQRRAADVKPENPLAEQLLRQFAQQAPSEVVKPTASPFWNDLQHRYRRNDTFGTAAWLIAELVLAAITCLVVMRFATSSA